MIIDIIVSQVNFIEYSLFKIWLVFLLAEYLLFIRLSLNLNKISML